MAGADKYIEPAAPYADEYNRSRATHWQTSLIREHNALVDDLEAVRGGLDSGSTQQSSVNTWATEVDGDEDDICDFLDGMISPDGVLAGTYAFSAGGAPTVAATGWVKYRIAGVEYWADMPATITLEDLGNVTQSNFSAWRIEIDATGAVTAKASPTVGGYASAQIALLALCATALTSSACTLGYLTLTDSDSIINIGTDNLNASGVTATFYYERVPRYRAGGLNSSHTASTLDAGAATFSQDALDVNVNGLKKTQIASGAAKTVTDADTLATGRSGALLVITNLAANATMTVDYTGVPGVTALPNSSWVTGVGQATLAATVERLPAMFVPISLIFVVNASGAGFTFGTTFWDAAGVTSTIYDATVTGWKRSRITAPSVDFAPHQIFPGPNSGSGAYEIPATVTAPIPDAGTSVSDGTLTAAQLQLTV